MHIAASCEDPATAPLPQHWLLASEKKKNFTAILSRDGGEKTSHAWAFLNSDRFKGNITTSNNGCESSQTIACVLWNQRADQSMDLIILHPAACNNDSGELSLNAPRSSKPSLFTELSARWHERLRSNIGFLSVYSALVLSENFFFHL